MSLRFVIFALALSLIACTRTPDSGCVVVASTLILPTTVCGKKGAEVPVEGDLVVTIPTLAADLAAPMVVREWEDLRVPYLLDRQVAQSTTLMRSLDAAIANLAAKGVQLTARVASEPDFLVLQVTSGLPRSHLGRIGGAQALWLKEDATPQDIVHLVAHAVGLPHESDRALGGAPSSGMDRLPERLLTERAARQPPPAPERAIFGSHATTRRHCKFVLPDEATTPCKGPTPPLEYCMALCSLHPQRAELDAFVQLAAIRLRGRTASFGELDRIAARMALEVPWTDQERLLIHGSPDPATGFLPTDVAQLAGDCPVFSAAYYREKYPELALASDDDARRHWLTRGIWQQRTASPVFSLGKFATNVEAAAGRVYETPPEALRYLVAGIEIDPAHVMDSPGGPEEPILGEQLLDVLRPLCQEYRAKDAHNP